MEYDSFKITNETANGENEDNGKGESQRSGKIVQDVSFEEFIKLYGFDPRVLDDTLDHVTSNEVATIPVPELNEEFDDITLVLFKSVF
ncbi:hypothetical protein DPMN_136785 [Dreissena polymorpha]|uniref:Uncharacterized protein n=1 Tax=Dreissena polymorpha TaxID=45954 RepID=A0A9D4JCZ6_DREPO|nr:hypothetical protein DPMN_136785 [Dreissena polymorpha]